MKRIFLFPSALLLIVIWMSSQPLSISATSWAYPFVVWEGYIYVVTDEGVHEVDKEIGHVTKYSDMEQFGGNFSNSYKKGTPYYSIKGVSTEEAIAVETSKGEFVKATRESKYEFKDKSISSFHITIGIIVLFFGVIFIRGFKKG